MTVAELKRLLRIPAEETENDDYFSVILPLAMDHARDYCNQDFRDEDGNDDFPGGVRLGIARLIEYQMNKAAGVQSYTLARESTTWAASASGLPQEVESLWNPHRGVYFL